MERTDSEAGLDACRSAVVDGGTKDLTWVSFRYCSAMDYEAVS